MFQTAREDEMVSPDAMANKMCWCN